MGKFSGVLLASDLDGTLYNRQHDVSEENLAAIRRFTAQGGLFTVATGRAVQSFQVPRRKIPLEIPVVMANGSLIYDFNTETVLHTAPLTEGYLPLCRAVREVFPTVAVEAHLLDSTWVAGVNAVSESHLATVGTKGELVDTVDDIPAGWLKALFTGETAELQHVLDWFLPRYGSQYDLLFSTPFFLELQDKSANKGIGVAWLADYMGVAHEHVYCVGDQENDLSMLMRFTSFAPENARSEVKEISRHSVPDCDEHAVAAVIDWLEERYT